MSILKSIFGLTAAVSISLLPQTGVAQVSLDDLKARSSAATSEMDQLREILSSGNQDQAMAALKIVMAEGSIEQRRVALEASLSSTSQAVRRTGLEAYFNARPMVAFMFDGSKLQNASANNFRRYFNSYGTIEDNQLGRFAFQIGEFLPDQQCWSWAVDPSRCMFALTDENVILYLSAGVPGIGAIGTDGIVRGNVTVPNSTTVPYAFIVKF